MIDHHLGGFVISTDNLTILESLGEGNSMCGNYFC